MNINSTKQNTYDAIVVGTGISGGWAIKELCEKGLKVLALERGRDVKHGEYPTANLNPWEVPHNDQVPEEELEKHYHVQNRTGYTVKQTTKHWWVKDDENPYTEVKRFDWVRGYHVGGRSLLWGRQSYRWSEMDFEANAKDGIAIDWPIRYKDLEPWYDYVETFAGISGQAEGLPQLPDGKFLPPMAFNCMEEHFKSKVEAEFPDRRITIGRTAILTQKHNGRGPCQYRNRCIRGCPFGAYFSSQSATLPAAVKTGNMTLRPHSIVNSVIYDDQKGKATGVRVIDAETGEMEEFYAKIIFLNASTLGSTFVMMNSISDRFPNGLGNDSGELGHNLMDHHFLVGASGSFDGLEDKYYAVRRANGIYIPRFRNISDQRDDYIRGFGYQGGGSRGGMEADGSQDGFGADWKEDMAKVGPWGMRLTGFGECLPYHENHVVLDNDKKDKWGQPTFKIDCEFKENEMKMRKDMADSAVEMLEAAGLRDVKAYDRGGAPGLGIHEMGTARMGKDPKTAVLNEFNQVHGAPNVFVTDGAAMTSSACQNPSLTYMALTARACDHAVKELNKQNI